MRTRSQCRAGAYALPTPSLNNGTSPDQSSGSEDAMPPPSAKRKLDACDNIPPSGMCGGCECVYVRMSCEGMCTKIAIIVLTPSLMHSTYLLIVSLVHSLTHSVKEAVTHTHTHIHSQQRRPDAATFTATTTSLFQTLTNSADQTYAHIHRRGTWARATPLHSRIVG